MPYRVTNRSGRFLTVELTDGRTVHLAPGETSPEVDDASARLRRPLARLVEAGLLAVDETPVRSPRSSARAGRARSST